RGRYRETIRHALRKSGRPREGRVDPGAGGGPGAERNERVQDRDVKAQTLYIKVTGRRDGIDTKQVTARTAPAGAAPNSGHVATNLHADTSWPSGRRRRKGRGQFLQRDRGASIVPGGNRFVHWKAFPPGFINGATREIRTVKRLSSDVTGILKDNRARHDP